MRSIGRRALVSVFCAASALSALPAFGDWPAWRGPNANGTAKEGQKPPIQWSESTNIVWKADIPGRGHSSPILVGNRILLSTADESEKTQSVLCLARDTGDVLWTTQVSQDGFERKIHPKNSFATPTLASDGERVFAVFCNHGKVQLTSLDMDGKQLLQVNVGEYQPKAYEFGYASSPVLYKSMVIIASEYERGYLVAVDAKTGQERWRMPRPAINYSSPIIGRVDGKDQLLISGGGTVMGYNPANGKLLWTVPGIWQATCGTLVWDGDTVFASGGYPGPGTMAVAADGSKRVLWKNNTKCYEQSLVAHDGHLYAVDDNGIAHCWQAKDGKMRWQQRLGGKPSASPIVAGGYVYSTNESGTTYVFKANPRQYEAVGRNQLGDEGFATAAFVDSRIYMRTATGSGAGRQETLYCIGEP